MRTRPTSSFTIIAGNYRRRSFAFSADKNLRPTPGRVRETLFNWLQFDIVNKKVLDCFAGSGALGFEALSRGANEVFLVENNKKTADNIADNIATLHNNNIRVINCDIFDINFNKSFDVVFIDPPFYKNLIIKTIKFLANKKLINNKSLLYIESEHQISDSNLNIIKQKKAASVHYCLTTVNNL